MSLDRAFIDAFDNSAELFDCYFYIGSQDGRDTRVLRGDIYCRIFELFAPDKIEITFSQQNQLWGRHC